MRDSTMTQYLAQIKTIVDNIAADGSIVDVEDIIHHILNGLPPSYNAFKTAIRTNQQPIGLDTLYSLLCSEEVNIQNESHSNFASQPETVALYADNRTSRGRVGRFYRGRGSSSRSQFSPSTKSSSSATASSVRPICQICSKAGHTALTCWHRCNLQYTSAPHALLTQASTPNAEWTLDSGASSHLTSDAHNIQQPVPYQGLDSISIANGSQLPIQHSGQGILPLPDTNRFAGQSSASSWSQS